MLTISYEDLEDEMTEASKKNGTEFKGEVPTPFEFLLGNSFNNKEFEKLAKEAFQFFFHEEISFLYEQKVILLGNLEEEVSKIKTVEELRLIREEEYFDIQNCLREALGEKTVEKPDPDEDPRVKRIKAKARYRDRVKAKNGDGLTLGDSLASICCMGLGITPLNIGEMSYAAISVIMERYQEHEKYDTDVRSILAGADSKKIKPKYWIRNLDNNK